MPEISQPLPSNIKTDEGARMRQRYTELYQIAREADAGNLEPLRVYGGVAAWSSDTSLADVEKATAIATLLHELMTLDYQMKSTVATGPKGRKPGVVKPPKAKPVAVSEETNLMEL